MRQRCLLGRKLDKASYALKGGCTLRFFIGSPRYSEDMNIVQKVEALATRRVTQARDIFDLHLLLASGSRLDLEDERVARAAWGASSNALALGFDVFRALEAIPR